MPWMKNISADMTNLSEKTDQLYVGIDAGSVSLNCMVINHKKEIVYEYPYTRHRGNVEEAVLVLIQDLYATCSEEKIQSISFTGNHGRKLGEKLRAFYEFETISQILGAVFICPDVKTIISMGGQETALFQIDHYDGGWELKHFDTNGPCASGTGSFIDQQAQRLATSIYDRNTDVSRVQIDKILTDFIQLGLKSKKPSNVACRCTVFTKSDMIHLQNKGERLEDIIHGLHVGNARNFISTIVSNSKLEDPIIFIGGLSINALQVKTFEKEFPGLIVPPYNTSIGALGVALQGFESGEKNRFNPDMLSALATDNNPSIPSAPRLKLKKTVFPESNVIPKRLLRVKTPTYLGIDVGSTTVKYALIDENRSIIHKNYVPTRGKPIEVAQKLLKSLRDDLGEKIKIAGAATTGSGRNVVGDFLNVDLIIDEITAHARGAVEIDPKVDTVFEIGGQDSKYIYIANTYPLDFDMNKVCAAGTGSFLHELANKFGVNIAGEFQDIALSSEAPVKLAERCTVFMESDIVSYQQKGASKNDLMAGLCYAIVHNYLNRVVGKRKIGKKIMFLGGPSLNKGVVAAFENVFGHGLLVPLHREVLGAYGAAISVQEKMQSANIKESMFRGLDNAINDRMSYKEKVCRADPQCCNQCKLKIYDFEGRRSIWGGECGRYELTGTRGDKKKNFFELRETIWQKYMDGLYEELQEKPIAEINGRPTVGMQRALYTLQTGVLWAYFFDRLGFRLVLTPPTNTHISKVGIASMMAETCYPVKVSFGHIRELVGKTRYLFIPTLINMSTPEENEAGLYCPIVQSNAYMARMSFNMDQTDVLSPTIHLKYDPDTLALEIAGSIQTKLGVTLPEIKKALYYGLKKQKQFLKDLHKKGREILKNQNPEEPVVIVTGRPYNLYDEMLNLRLGRNLARIGVAALPMDFIDVDSVSLSDFPSMYWGLGAQILRTAKIIKAHQNYFGLHLTNFGCGADSFIEHFYKNIMEEKPYLILELDEHSAVAGVMTRLEAYKNILENTMTKLKKNQKSDFKLASN